MDELHPIVYPDQVLYWPPETVGWYVLAGLVLVLVLWGSVTGIRRWRRNRYRRVALDTLGRLEPRLRTPETRPLALQELATLIKRVALHGYTRSDVASLSGNGWLTFLTETGRRTDFLSDTGRLLAEVTYRPVREINALQVEELAVLLRLSQRWIKTHRPKP